MATNKCNKYKQQLGVQMGSLAIRPHWFRMENIVTHTEPLPLIDEEEHLRNTGTNVADMATDLGMLVQKPYCEIPKLPHAVLYSLINWLLKIANRDMVLDIGCDDNTILKLKIAALAEQLDKQSKEIRELKYLLIHKNEIISDVNKRLQHEVLARSSLGTQNMELLALISELNAQTIQLKRKLNDLAVPSVNNNHSSNSSANEFNYNTPGAVKKLVLNGYCETDSSSSVSAKRLFGRIQRDHKAETIRMVNRQLENNPLQLQGNDVAEMLHCLGLEQYTTDLQRYIAEEAQADRPAAARLCADTIERSGCIRNRFHLKKIKLYLAEVSGRGPDAEQLTAAGRLSTDWVLRWLDDIGLPQYKECFATNEIDGRMLHRLTVDELLQMNINSQLHMTSIRCGILVLRKHNFATNCLQRRPIVDYSPQQPGMIDTSLNNSQNVELWTIHRVMEWLQSIDMSEYAINLKSSGTHGGVMIHEDRFTAELLASLLLIPTGKTLIRRHLLMHFKELLGADVMQRKRDVAIDSSIAVLTPMLKYKTPTTPRRAQFSLRRKKIRSRSSTTSSTTSPNTAFEEELYDREWVCPLQTSHRFQSALNQHVLNKTV